MPVNVFCEQVVLSLPVIETLPFSADGPLPACYPWPTLRPTGEVSERPFEVVVIQSDRLEVRVLPDLGGRIHSIVDRASGTAAWPALAATVDTVGARGAEIRSGIEWRVGNRLATRGLGRVEYRLQEPATEDSPGGVLLFELMPDEQIAWQASVSLTPQRAAATLELQVQNRSWLPWMGPFGWSLPDSGNLVSVVTGAREGTPGQALWPRQAVTARLEIAVAELSGPTLASGKGLVIAFDGAKLSLLAFEDVGPCTVFLQPERGSTLEAGLTLAAGDVQAITLPLDVGQPQAILVRNDRREELLRWLRADEPTLAESATTQALVRAAESDEGPEGAFFAAVRDQEGAHDWRRWEDSVPCQAGAWSRLASQAAAGEQYADAVGHVDRAISVAAEDVLLWAQRAILSRLAGGDDERADLLNAHYLSPLEPILRAEAFLAIGPEQGREANPVSKPLADDPNAGLEAVDRLIEWGLTAEAVRLLDELLRHRERAMFHLALAGLHLAAGKTEATAAEHVRRASQLPVEPPFPFRSREINLLGKLINRFPNESNLAVWASLAERGAKA